MLTHCMSNRLRLNPAKTEVLWCSSARRQHQIPTGPARVGDTSVLLVRTVRYLGVYIDALSAHVTAIVKACFAALRQIRSVRRSLTRTTLLTLVHGGHKGGLLQLSSLGYFRTAVTVAAVSLQRRRSSHVLCEEVGAHNSTAR